MSYNDYQEWLSKGIEQGWISDAYCTTHDGPPMTDEEYAEFDQDNDPCIFALRVWEENLHHD